MMVVKGMVGWCAGRSASSHRSIVATDGLLPVSAYDDSMVVMAVEG